MSLKDDFLQLLEFPTLIKFSEKTIFNETDTLGISSSDKILIDNQYVDYYKYKKREREEFWKSVDIYIKIERNDDVLNLINNFLIENELSEQKKLKKFNDIKNNEKLFDFVTKDNFRVNIIRYENRIVIMLTMFDY
ncbi:hypothetical protein [Algibacter sp. L4_22]|uniref:hypothetical protein n=1 Tax=Algibacter sp. L4_22 TaxID=2942477 RepID=UPI00201B8117|nr:hypothetical protein [Algibacter sp. L4_22]MCL5130556.1 hypothetical protein [Algibacter sp. L4_22]